MVLLLQVRNRNANGTAYARSKTPCDQKLQRTRRKSATKSPLTAKGGICTLFLITVVLYHAASTGIRREDNLSLLSRQTEDAADAAKKTANLGAKYTRVARAATALQPVTNEMPGALNTVDKSDFITDKKDSKEAAVIVSKRRQKQVVRDKSAFPAGTQMGWAQVEKILEALPTDGSLLVWGLGNDSPFWDGVTTGRVIFLEDGDMSTNLRNGRRWFDDITAKYPQLEAYTIDYTTKNTKAAYDTYVRHPENWKQLELKDLPNEVRETRWDVIIVDAPLGCCNSGPARYQSLYQTKRLVMASQILAKEAGQVNSISEAAVHVFVDDYERKIEHEFSQQVFGKPPVEVIKREAGVSNANKQAHFIFGDPYAFALDKKDGAVTQRARLVPWSHREAQAPSSPLSAPESWVVLLEVNDGYFDFFLNWLLHYNSLNIGIKVVVIAEDDVVNEKLQGVLAKYPLLTIERSALQLEPAAFVHKTKEYNIMVSARATHILQKLEAGTNVIYSDVDTVWRSNPLAYFAATDEADMIIQVDEDKLAGLSPSYCTGFMAVVSNKITIDFFLDWQEALTRPQPNQPVFNEILHRKSAVAHQPLPSAEFPSGMLFFGDKLSDTDREKAVVVHNNFIRGHDKKKQRFEGHGLWKVE